MHNNLVYVTGEGLVDAAEINGVRWSQLCAANTPSTKQKLVKCAWCWDEHREAHWMKTFDREGSRVVSHQPGAGIADHPYEALETPQHRAWNYRAARVGAEAGYGVEVESWSADKKTRADVLLVGERTVAYEHQHSPFKKGRGALERTRLAKAAGRDEVMWHGTNELIVGRARVPMLLSADLPPEVIENPAHRIRVGRGIVGLVHWTCTARDGHLCPDRKLTGCGKTHVRWEPRPRLLDDCLRMAPAGELLTVRYKRADGRIGEGWTDLDSHRVYAEHLGESGLPLDGRTSVGPKKKPATVEGHSRRPSITVSRAAPLLDWRDRSHFSRVPGPCRICGGTSHLLDDAGWHAHKVCVENEQAEGAAS